MTCTSPKVTLSLEQNGNRISVGRCLMKNLRLTCLLLLVFSHPTWAIYGPSITRANAAVEFRACGEANFTQSSDIVSAAKSRNPEAILKVLGSALKEWRSTAANSNIYPARAFCIHDLVPEYLPAGTDRNTPTASVVGFQKLGIDYFYYSPDGEWRPSGNPVDLEQLAGQYLDSPWGRQAFLMMTQLGWSKGGCQEGPDQFREVIKRSEKFLLSYPDSEVSDQIRLELANAYATWWNLSRGEPNSHSNPKTYTVGAAEAKIKAIDLYKEYLGKQKVANKRIRDWMKALESNPAGSGTYDYSCEDYED